MEILADHVEQVAAWLDALPDTAVRFGIVYHGDCDGVISAALFDHVLKRTREDTEIHSIPVRTEQYDFVDALLRLSRHGPDAAIFLDLSIQNHLDKLQRAAEIASAGVLVYDHHSQDNDRVPANTLYLNPSITPEGESDTSPPPCLLAARLAEACTGTDFDWAACIGLIAESAVESFLPIFQKLPRQFPVLFPVRDITGPEDVYSCRLRDISYAVGSAFWAEPDRYEHLAFEILSRMILLNSPQAFFDRSNSEAQQLVHLERKVRAEINRLYIQGEYDSYYVPEASLRYTEVTSEYRIGGVVATRLSHRHKDDIVVTGQRYSGRYVIEARRGSRIGVDVAKLLARATRDLAPFSVGGHPAAAGATLPPDCSSQFFLALEAAAHGLPGR